MRYAWTVATKSEVTPMTDGWEAWCPICESWSDDVYRCSNPDCGADLAGRDAEVRAT